MPSSIITNATVISSVLLVSGFYCVSLLTPLSYIHLEDTDDETGQVLRGMDSLPSILRRYVHEDNRWFQQELIEWEEQFGRTASPQGESTAFAEPPNPSPGNIPQTEVEQAPQSGPTTEELDQTSSSEQEPDTEAVKDPEPDPREKPEGL